MLNLKRVCLSLQIAIFKKIGYVHKIQTCIGQKVEKKLKKRHKQRFSIHVFTVRSIFSPIY